VLPDEQRDLRIGAIAVSLLVCAGVRLALAPDLPPFELVPILAAGLWFGRRWALIVAGIAGVVIVAAAALSNDVALEMVAAELALLAITAYLVAGLAERARLADAELERIRPLQDVLAPRTPPPLPLLELASRYIPAQSGVSGDFYQVAEGRNGAAILVIGDVVGKGMAAARRSTFVRAMVTACAPYLDDPAGILRTVNTELVHQHGASAQFITMLCVVVRPDATVVWASAGHPPPVSLADGLPLGELRTGHPLGIAPELADLETSRCALPPAGILLYTDGLTDARPPGRSFRPFGESRVAMSIGELDAPSPEQVVEHLARAAQTFSRGALPDDLCLVAVRPRFERGWYTGADSDGSAIDTAATTAD
jgi:serine phosphatase RsbU (regulator of sigma subunit)